MNIFKKTPVTPTELMKWKSSPLINPRTNRPITEKGKIHKYLETEYEKNFPQMKKIMERKVYEFNLIDSVDDKDPISLTPFWVENNGIKKIVYDDLDNLIMYKDSHNLIRCFEKESLEYMKAHSIKKHPVTMDDIPGNLFEKIVAKDLFEERKYFSLRDKAFEVFQKFSSLSIFIDSDWFMDLDKEQLIKFNYELGDLYKQNIPIQQRKEISETDLFNLKNHDLAIQNENQIQEYLINDMDKLLDVKKEELKYMCNYLLVGSLGIVIPKIRELYPDVCFSFAL